MCRSCRIKTIGVVETEVQVCKQVNALCCARVEARVGARLRGASKETIEYFHTVGTGVRAWVASAVGLAFVGCFAHANLVPRRLATKCVQSAYTGFACGYSAAGSGGCNTAFATGAGLAPALRGACCCGFVYANLVPRRVTAKRVQSAYTGFASCDRTTGGRCGGAAVTWCGASTLGRAVNRGLVDAKCIPGSIATESIQGTNARFTCRIVATRRGCRNAAITRFYGCSQTNVRFSDTVGR